MLGICENVCDAVSVAILGGEFGLISLFQFSIGILLCIAGMQRGKGSVVLQYNYVPTQICSSTVWLLSTQT